MNLLNLFKRKPAKIIKLEAEQPPEVKTTHKLTQEEIEQFGQRPKYMGRRAFKRMRHKHYESL